MNAKLTELVFILDRSGSMGGLESDTIGGFNSMIEKQKKDGNSVNVTTILFDHKIEFIHDRFPIEIIEPLTEDDYYVRGKAGKVIFVIITDGLENSSDNYTYSEIRRKIEARKECGWQFLFLGANIDAGEEAEKIGIDRKRSVTYSNDSEGILLNFRTIGRVIRRAVDMELNDDTDYDDLFEDDWADEIEEYCEKSQK